MNETHKNVETILTDPRLLLFHRQKAFLSLVSYYSRFVLKLSTLAPPLNQLMQKYVKFQCEVQE